MYLSQYESLNSGNIFLCTLEGIRTSANQSQRKHHKVLMGNEKKNKLTALSARKHEWPREVVIEENESTTASRKQAKTVVDE